MKSEDVSRSDAGNTLTCARTQDTGWGGRGKDYGSNSASYRCVYSDPQYYAAIPTNCRDVWVGGTPTTSPGLEDSSTALMYQIKGNPPTARDTWERSCKL